MSEEYINFIPYPTGVFRVVSRLPLQFYKVGMGWLINWFPVMILTTRGRMSGKPRHAALEYRRHGSKYYLISAWGQQPDWFKNLTADPVVTLQHGSVVRRARAVVVTNSAEKLRAVYMFRRNSMRAELILARMSTADTIDMSTLLEVADEFTVVRLDVERGEIPLPPVKAEPASVGRLALLLGAVVMIWAVLRSLRR